MNKDVVYIDVEDDITAIIGKVKQSKDKVVALVPPKRIGVLQSAVNLRLLARAAKQSDKHLAIVTNNQSLIALASAAAIPVAKNLQTKPELAEIPALEVDDGEDVIDGGSLPIGDHARLKDKEKDARAAAMASALAEAPNDDEAPKKPKVKSGTKVPNFDTFRKKLVFVLLAIILLIGFLVWAIFFAPRATIVISAKTSSSSINAPVTISSTAQTSASASTLKAALQQESQDKSQSFTASGQKDAGTKATGSVTFSTDSILVARRGVVIPAGSTLTSSSGAAFITNSAVSLSLDNPSGTTVVTASQNGSAYNAATGPLSGAPNGVSAAFDSPTSGGVSKTVTVVTADDVQKAKQALVDGNTDQIKASLKQKFGSDASVIDQSFAVEYGDVKVSPDVGQEATQATLTTKVTYKLYAVQKPELDNFLNGLLKDQLKNNANQQVYKNGSDKVVFQEATAAENGAKATLIATAQIGPKIENAQVKQLAKGKRYGEIQEALEGIQGVDSVDVKFFPFWVSSVPSDDARITVDFTIKQ